VSSGAADGLDPSIAALIEGLPKVELHVHLEGSIPPATALALARRRGVSLPGAEGGVEGLRARYRFSDFRSFIDLYLAISSTLVEAEDFEEAVAEVGRDLAAQNVRYAEMTVTPMTHVARGVGDAVLLDGLVRGRARAREEHGVELAWVFDIVRTLPDQAAPTLELALRGRDHGVVGLGLSGPEARPHDIEALAPVFARARAEGLASLPHAGEMAGPESVRAALDRLGAHRIGHGVRSLEDPALVERLVAERIPLEVCPSSNVALGVVPSLREHPLPALIDAGIELSLASDDPPLFGTSLVEEFRRSARAFGFDATTIRHLAAAAVRHACLAERRKAELLAAQDQVLSG
jgi:adenosine deaminase